jgi:hypothetical protein
MNVGNEFPEAEPSTETNSGFYAKFLKGNFDSKVLALPEPIINLPKRP